jgi:hypothetical protein
MPFQKGESGNPNGRPKGALNKTTTMARSLLEGEAEALIKKVVQLALEGDLTCLRICFERLVPATRDIPAMIDLPDIAGVADMPKLFAAISARLREGITNPQAATFIHFVEAFQKSLETVELEVRVSALEEQAEAERGKY